MLTAFQRLARFAAPAIVQRKATCTLRRIVAVIAIAFCVDATQQNRVVRPHLGHAFGIGVQGDIQTVGATWHLSHILLHSSSWAHSNMYGAQVPVRSHFPTGKRHPANGRSGLKCTCQ